MQFSTKYIQAFCLFTLLTGLTKVFLIILATGGPLLVITCTSAVVICCKHKQRHRRALKKQHQFNMSVRTLERSPQMKRHSIFTSWNGQNSYDYIDSPTSEYGIMESPHTFVAAPGPLISCNDYDVPHSTPIKHYEYSKSVPRLYTQSSLKMHKGFTPSTASLPKEYSKSASSLRKEYSQLCDSNLAQENGCYQGSPVKSSSSSLNEKEMKSQRKAKDVRYSPMPGSNRRHSASAARAIHMSPNLSNRVSCSREVDSNPQIIYPKRKCSGEGRASPRGHSPVPPLRQGSMKGSQCNYGANQSPALPPRNDPQSVQSEVINNTEQDKSVTV